MSEQKKALIEHGLPLCPMLRSSAVIMRPRDRLSSGAATLAIELEVDVYELRRANRVVIDIDPILASGHFVTRITTEALDDSAKPQA
jgi:hypothetical protein